MSHNTIRRAVVGATVVALGTTATAVGAQAQAPARAAAGASAAAACSVTWGSLPKVNSSTTAGPMRNLRAGRHTCFDRLVVDLDGRPTGYRVAYVDQLAQPGSGEVVSVRGGARLKITVNAPAYDSNGQATYQPANRAEAVDVRGYSTLRQVRWLGTFEGASEIGVGVRARLPMRVTRYDDGGSTRLVIDIAHSW